MSCITAQACAIAVGTIVRAEIFGQIFAHHLRIGFAITPFHVGQNAFKRMFAFEVVAAFIDEAEGNLLVAAAIQDYFAMFGIEFFEWRFHCKTVMVSQRGQHLEIIDVATVPAAYGAFCQ